MWLLVCWFLLFHRCHFVCCDARFLARSLWAAWIWQYWGCGWLYLARDVHARRLCTDKTMSPFPFTLNGMWSWWQISFRFWTKWHSIWFKIERKTITTIISIQCERKRKHSFVSVFGTSSSTRGGSLVASVEGCKARWCVAKQWSETIHDLIWPCRTESDMQTLSPQN